MSVKEFLEFRKHKENYKYEEDYINDNKIKFLVYWGRNGRYYTKRLDSKLTQNQLDLNLDQVINDVVWGY